ncbi:MAG: glycoside hydrolase family 3 C-terminal domain-containing protein [Lachnospiraceae bacterium]|nr:glycoside hydrolase family 3 C-terminal domain-containing protein [Lachnospiraceae bacterium]
MIDFLIKLLGPTLYGMGVSEADLLSYLTQLQNYIYAIVGIFVALIVILILAHFAKKGFRHVIRWEAVMAFFAAILIMVNSICYGPMYTNVSGFLNASKAEFSEETIANSKETIKKIGEEGIVLVKNEGLLPLSSDVSSLNVFGWDSTSPVFGGTGSAGSHSEGAIGILQSLQDAGYKTNETLSNMYTEYLDHRPEISMAAQDWSLPEPNVAHYTDEIMTEAKDFSDTAVIVIGRPGGEGADLPTDMNAVIKGTYNQGLATSNAPANWRYMNASYVNNGAYDDFEPGESYLELSVTEEQMVEKVCSEFENVVVIINANNTMELGWTDEYEQIKSVLLAPGVGNTGFAAIG